MKIVYSIHPAIGIARVGNSKLTDEHGNPSPKSYFIGPEVPGFGFEPEPRDGQGQGAGEYRDGQGALRRQGARFRIYERTINELGAIVATREITNDVAQITWKVHLANTKAAGDRFPPYFYDQWGKDKSGKEFGTLRNRDERDRSRLIITTGRPVSIVSRRPGATIPSKNTKAINGHFLGKKVKLGDLLTDDKGRLIVLGGHGKIGGQKRKTDTGEKVPDLSMPGLPAHQVYNYDKICDDTSDGWITAKLVFEDGTKLSVDKPEQRAWVIVAPPNHAPAVQSVITLFDVVRQANLQYRPDQARPVSLSFIHDIYPFLRRVVDHRYVSDSAWQGHGHGKPGDFLDTDVIAVLSSNSLTHASKRSRILSYLTRQGAADDEIKMPKLYGGVDPLYPTKKPVTHERTRLDSFGIAFTVTPYQRLILEEWSKGNFEADWEGEPQYKELDEFNTKDQPDLIDRAALEDCAGGSFHPGIEAPYIMAQPQTFEEWFRIRSTKKPGDITQGLAVPWHTDFYACTEYWWPAQRPNVVPVSISDQGKWIRDKWARDPQQKLNTYEDILKLGFIKVIGWNDGKRLVLEDERDI